MKYNELFNIYVVITLILSIIYIIYKSKLNIIFSIEIHNSDVLINLNITMTYIADMFGATRETISRSMKILQENGFIKMRNKQIIVLNRKKLAEYFKS